MERGFSHKLCLAGDIGGTKTNLGLFSLGDERPVLQAMESYASAEATGLDRLVELFLSQCGATVSAACFGIAGPVSHGRARVTNLPWEVSEKELGKRFGWDRVTLINDLTATAYAVPVLRDSELDELNAGEVDPEGCIGLVAPGTGLGIGLIAVENGRFRPLPSEGGHVEFAPKDRREMDLLLHLMERMPHVSLERVAAGPGLFTIYSWIREYRNHVEPVWLTRKIETGDPSEVVSQAGMEERDPVCAEALELFVSIIGSAAGNLALTAMTTGGIYLGGGICPKILPMLKKGPFLESFAAKGRFTDLLRNVPVKVILNDKAALLGAACHTFNLCKN
jgi:glucokinase